MDPIKSLHSLHFDYDQATNDNVNSISAIQAHTFVFDRQISLAFKWNVSQRHFMAKTLLIGGLQ